MDYKAYLNKADQEKKKKIKREVNRLKKRARARISKMLKRKRYG